MESITLREKMKYLTFKTSTPLTTFHIVRGEDCPSSPKRRNTDNANIQLII